VPTAEAGAADDGGGREETLAVSWHDGFTGRRPQLGMDE